MYLFSVIRGLATFSSFEGASILGTFPRVESLVSIWAAHAAPIAVLTKLIYFVRVSS